MKTLNLMLEVGGRTHEVMAIPWSDCQLKVFAGPETYFYDIQTRTLERDKIRSKKSILEIQTPPMGELEDLISKELVKHIMGEMP